MRKLKGLIYIFLVAFAGLILMSGFCLAAQNHACCPKDKTAKCPMQSMQKASSSDSAKAVKCPYLKTTTPKPVKARPVKPVSHSDVPEFFLPNYHLSSKIAHQTTAPPQA